MTRNPFAYSNQHLLDRLIEACLKAGNANNDKTLDIVGPSWIEEARYLKEVVLSKLDGQSPPFTPGDTVRLQDEEPLSDDNHCFEPLPAGSERIVAQVRYPKFYQWRLVFEGTVKPNGGAIPLFDTARFITIRAAANTAGN